MGKLVNTFFEGGADDKLAALDAYTKTSSGTKSTLSENVLGGGNRVLDSIKTIPFDARDISSMIKVDGGMKLDKAAATKRIGEVLNNNGVFKAFSAEVQNTVSDALGSPGSMSKYLVGVNGLYKEIVASDVTDVKGIVGLLNNLSGNSEYASLFDVGGTFALVNSIVGKAMSYGLVDAAQELMDKVKDDETRRKLQLANIRSLMTASDLDGVNKVIDNFGVEAVLSRVPDAVDTIVTCYQFPDSAEPVNQAECYAKLLGLLNRLNSGWAVIKRGVAMVTNLAPFTAASDDARLLFLNDPVYREAALTAPNYPKQPLIGLMTEQYPLAVFG